MGNIAADTCFRRGDVGGADCMAGWDWDLWRGKVWEEDVSLVLVWTGGDIGISHKRTHLCDR